MRLACPPNYPKGSRAVDEEEEERSRNRTGQEGEGVNAMEQ